MTLQKNTFIVGRIHSLEPKDGTLRAVVYSYEIAGYIAINFHKPLVKEGQEVNIMHVGEDVISVVDEATNTVIYDREREKEGNHITIQELIDTWADTTNIRIMHELRENQQWIIDMTRLYFEQFHIFYLGKLDTRNPGTFDCDSIQMFMCNARNVAFQAFAVKAYHELYQTYYRLDIDPKDDLPIIEKHYKDFQEKVGMIPLPYQHIRDFRKEVYKIRDNRED